MVDTRYVHDTGLYQAFGPNAGDFAWFGTDAVAILGGDFRTGGPAII